MAGTPLEVACTCADQYFILTDDALTASPADAAVRVHDNGTGIHKDIDQTFF